MQSHPDPLQLSLPFWEVRFIINFAKFDNILYKASIKIINIK